MTLLRVLRWSAASAIVVVAATASWLSASAAIGIVAHQRPGRTATYPESAGSDVLADSAERAFAKKQPARALPWAIEAVRASPMSARALRILGQIEGSLGDFRRYNDLMALAAAAGWRDAPTQNWALRRAVTTNDMNSAIERGEALVRNDQARTEVLTVFRVLATLPSARRTLVGRLAEQPDWRQWFFELRGNVSPEQLSAVAAVLTDLQASRAKASSAEARATLAALVNAGQFDTAWTLYKHLFGQRPAKVFLTDPGFDRSDADYKPGGNATIFDWTLLDQSGGEVAIARQDDFAANHALAVTVDAPSELVLAEQAAALAPGTYRLAYRARSDDVETEAKVRWQVYCVKASMALGPSNAPSLTPDWSSRSLRFTVPADCPGVRVRLLAEPGKATSTYWFDDVTIERDP